MPELPEVENVRQSLSHQLPEGSELQEVKLFRKDLRFPIPTKSIEALIGSKLKHIERRGKYILFIFSEGIIISHLGMTGHWRVTSSLPEHTKHDHVRFLFSNHSWLTYNDSRRFGYLQFVRHKSELTGHPLFVHLGVEPLSKELTGEYLKQKSSRSIRAVKVFLMNQEVVVGVGNIYASEILFRAKIRPQKKAGQLSLAQWNAVVKSTQFILEQAIRSGGSSIRNYRNADGAEGNFQSQHKVYGKKGQPCSVCATPIKSQVMGGRATFWCPKCQV